MTNTRQFLAASALALLGTGAAFAQEATPDTWLQAAKLTQSRADVSADLAAARKSGLTKSWSAGYMERLGSTAARADVKAQTVKAIRSGEVKAINAEAVSTRTAG